MIHDSTIGKWNHLEASDKVRNVRFQFDQLRNLRWTWSALICGLWLNGGSSTRPISYIYSYHLRGHAEWDKLWLSFVNWLRSYLNHLHFELAQRTVARKDVWFLRIQSSFTTLIACVIVPNARLLLVDSFLRSDHGGKRKLITLAYFCFLSSWLSYKSNPLYNCSPGRIRIH